MLKSIALKNFRNFESAEFSLDSRSLVFLGANGRGKSSLLEAVYFVSSLRSFRTARIREMRRIGSNGFEIRLKMRRKERWDQELRIEDFAERRLFLNGVPVRRASEFADSFQCVAFLPDDPVILTGSPVFRKRFLDMFNCMMDRPYFTALQKYASALRSRNLLLKERRSADRSLLSVYAALLADYGSQIVRKRLEILEILERKVCYVLSEIRPDLREFSIISRHSPASVSAERFLEKLEQSVEKDLERSMTLTGPHVDDFEMFCSGKPLRYFGSRGQCRMVSLALKLAEFELVSELADQVVVLVDDAVADLDRKARSAFFEKVRSAGQIFYAFTDLPEEKMFSDSAIIRL